MIIRQDGLNQRNGGQDQIGEMLSYHPPWLTSLELLHPRRRSLEAVGGGDVEHEEAVDVLDAQLGADVGRQQVSVPETRTTTKTTQPETGKGARIKQYSDVSVRAQELPNFVSCCSGAD